ncbi:MocR-like pyridoxine biosynthesis transcription factor PdxR [Phytomonospora endophytica]|uniref:GntR family transcriptional regulator/MocR family aminotransferase n=1 Tax=Phytomonospora endophytica TaxID=714109 RepID=A0A841FT95_9ACTN|nr:PLP-dependent aminotransferase family protein [Phytomonospora endophytica]MBB6039024.1 GntR family transcriptional regulator/MocR family aminotransferase [Phytomonospora endophytica]GIG69502.1 GntR family transcriptional regulator [Phytomonospora endophytica]
MELHVSLADGDLAAGIYRQLREAIVDGRLRPGERLPSTRDFAGRLAVSRNTVAVAYERLIAEGFCSARVGSGTFVAFTEPGEPAATGTSPSPRPQWRTDPAPDPRRFDYDFQIGVPDPALFPYVAWRRLVSRELRPSAAPLPGYASAAGHPGLREAVARHIGLSRAVRADPEDVLITQGAQQALDLTSRVLVEPGDTVAVEDPGYPPARDLFAALGARIAPVPVDAEGIDVDRIPPGTRLVYVTPSHQFPLGMPMSLARRRALLDWAERHDGVIVEDDYDSEFRYSERPLEPLYSLGGGRGRVLYVGSFSKVLSPLLRVGFLIAPPALRGPLRTARRLSGWHGEWWTQAALARFIDEGQLGRHVRKATRLYAARWERLTEGLAAIGGLTLVPGSAGLHVCVHGDFDGVAVAERAARLGVRVREVTRFGGTRQGLVLGFGVITAERVPEGLRRLATALRP